MTVSGACFRSAVEYGLKRDYIMIAIRQIHEQLASVIEVPIEIRNRRTEVIFLVVDGVTESPIEDPNGCDVTANQYFGCLPDFPQRAAQGEYETRVELP